MGREAERDLIADAVDRGAAGSGTPLIVSGDVGMGKTSLSREGLEMARGSGFERLEGRCQPLDWELAYAPIIEAFGRFLWGLRPSSQDPSRYGDRRASLLKTGDGGATRITLRQWHLSGP